MEILFNRSYFAARYPTHFQSAYVWVSYEMPDVRFIRIRKWRLFCIFSLLQIKCFQLLRVFRPLKTADYTLQIEECTLHTTNWRLHTTHYKLKIAHYTLRSEDCTLHTAHYTLHTAHYTLHTAHCSLHTAHYTVHTAHYTLHIYPCKPKNCWLLIAQFLNCSPKITAGIFPTVVVWWPLAHFILCNLIQCYLVQFDILYIV